MKKFILMMLVTVLSFGFSSCASSQSVYADYQKIYFDHVISGRIIADDYVWDGTYSYHVLTPIPMNVYWELCPIGWEVYVYTSNMVRIRLYDYTRRSIYYNRTHHNYYRFDDRHRPPYNPNHHGGHYGRYDSRPTMQGTHTPNTRGGNTQRPNMNGMQNRGTSTPSRPTYQNRGSNFQTRPSFSGSSSRGGSFGPSRGVPSGSSSRGGRR